MSFTAVVLPILSPVPMGASHFCVHGAFPDNVLYWGRCRDVLCPLPVKMQLFLLPPFNEHLPAVLKVALFLCCEPRSSSQSALLCHARWSRAPRGCPQPLPRGDALAAPVVVLGTWSHRGATDGWRQPGCGNLGASAARQCCPVGGSEALASAKRGVCRAMHRSCSFCQEAAPWQGQSVKPLILAHSNGWR